VLREGRGGFGSFRGLDFLFQKSLILDREAFARRCETRGLARRDDPQLLVFWKSRVSFAAIGVALQHQHTEHPYTIHDKTLTQRAAKN
jgi:hypothetical protein